MARLGLDTPLLVRSQRRASKPFTRKESERCHQPHEAPNN